MSGKSMAAAHKLEWREPGLRTSFGAFSDTLNGLRSGDSGAFVHGLREHALEALVKRGLPSSKEEDWRYTNIAHLSQSAYHFPQVESGALSAEVLADATTQLNKIACGNCYARLVFVDGWFISELSQLPDESTSTSVAGVTVQTLEQFVKAKASDSALHKALLAKLGSLATPENNSFDALNTAFLRDGVVVHLARGVKLEAPIQQIFIASSRDSSQDSGSRVNLGRTLLVAEESAEGTLFEIHLCSSSVESVGSLLKATTAEFFLADNAKFEHVKVINDGVSTDHFSTLHLSQGRDSRFRTSSFFLNARLVRSELYPALQGSGGNCEMHGLTLAGGEQLVDNFTAVNHEAPHCESTQLFKGIYAGKSRGVFCGTITVQQAAQKTNAFQKNASVLLSDEASVDTKPQLKIWADDVKCTHGATVGQLDEAALFYLRSRGVSKIEAQKMLVRAFAEDVTAKVEDAAIRDIVGKLVGERLDELHI